MTWRHWLGYLGAFAGLKWLMGRYGEEAGAYVVAGLLIALLLISYLLRAHRQHAELLVAQAEPEERAQLLGAMSPAQAAALRFRLRWFDDLDLSVAPPAVEFSYPPASLWLTTLLFWGSAICAAGLLVPILRRQAVEPSTAVGLLVAAALFIFAAFGYKLGHRWAGIRLRVDCDGLTEADPSGRKTSLPWKQLVNVNYRRWAGVLEYEGLAGQRICVGTTLINFAHFVQLTLIHRHQAPAVGAA